MINIRSIKENDWDEVWSLIKPVFRAGETYVFHPTITKEEAYRIWMTLPSETYVAANEIGDIVGTYYIKPNQPALGSHVCNCGYIVGENALGQGVASGMCIHSQHEALALGFRAMQYNLVVSTNVGAIQLWQKLGFEIIGTLPEAFHHPKLGFVDAHIMYKKLEI